MRTMLKGSRVSLRPVERSQLPQLQAWFSQYPLVRVLNPGTIKPLNLEAEEAWYRQATESPGTHTFTIMVADGEPELRLIGTCSLFAVDHKNRHAVLGISIADPDARGRGYGTEALQILLEWGFLELNLNRIALRVMEFNADARRLYERVGFKLEGTFREAIFREGRFWDEHCMAMLRSEYTPDPIWGLEAPAGVTP